MKTIVTLSLLASSFIIGCVPKQPATRQPYTGPTESMRDVVARINRNNEALPTLWARHNFEATVFDDQKKSHFVSGLGALLYLAPQRMKLIANHTVAGEIFELGSTDDRFWMKLVPEVDTMWWGKYENLGKPCARPIPLRPDLVLQVLGVGTINTDFNALPAPTMRFNNEDDSYMFVWVTKLADRWVAQKEIWYDRQTRRPKRVYLFDENGRVILRAALSKHQSVEVAGVAKENWPVVATDYRLLFPDTGTKMYFELFDMVLDQNGVIRRRGIEFPQKANVSKVIRIDEGCRD